MSKLTHKKRLVILNDNLFQATKDTEIMLDEGIEVKCLLLFDNNSNKIKIPEILKSKWENFNVDLVHVDSSNLCDILNSLYEDEDNIFLFDIDLNIDKKYSHDRKRHILWAIQNVRDKNSNRVFFYCTNVDFAEVKSINMYFPGKVLEFHHPNLNYEYPEVLIRYNEEFCKAFEI